MSYHVISAAKAVQSVTGKERALLIVMATYCLSTNTLWPSQETLASDTGECDRTIRRRLKGLERKGLIRREKRYSHGSRTSDLIVLTFVPENATSVVDPVSYRTKRAFKADKTCAHTGQTIRVIEDRNINNTREEARAHEERAPLTLDEKRRLADEVRAAAGLKRKWS